MLCVNCTYEGKKLKTFLSKTYAKYRIEICEAKSSHGDEHR